MENIICSTARNAGSPTAVLQMCIQYLQRWMETSLPPLLWKEGQKDLHRDLKSTKWESKVHRRFNYISRIAKCLLKTCWAKLAKDIKLLSTYSILEDSNCVRRPSGARDELLLRRCNMQSQESSSNNPSQISALSNISSRRWRSKYLSLKVHCIEQPTGSMKKRKNYWPPANLSTKHYWVQQKNTRSNALH